MLALGAIAACGGEATDASTGDEEVASLEAETSTGVEEGGTEDATLAADEAALAFSQCLRDEGIDVPDIGVDSEGNLALRDAFEDVDRTDTAFQDAVDECRDLLADAGFGGGGPGAFRNSTEFQDALLELSDCIRDEGFEEVGDLTVPAAGQDGAPPAGGQGQGEGPGRGQGEGGFGDRATTIAERLGLDPEDPAVIAAMDTCLPILDTALADAGLAQPGGQPDGDG